MEPQPAWVAELLKTNYPPSEQGAQEIRGLLFEPLKDLEELDNEIRILEQRILELSSRRSGIQKRIAPYKRIMSPLRRIPHEVLGEIFYHCLPAYRDPVISSHEFPLLITHVCNSWRDAAMRTPKLWDRLYIPFADDDSVPDQETMTELAQNGEITPGWHNAPLRALKQQRTDELRRRFEAVREWLSRSGTRGLSLSLFFIAAPWYTVPYSERPPSVTTEFLSFLASLAPRWKRLELRAPTVFHKALEDVLPISEMTTLTCLRAEYLQEQHIGGQHPTKSMIMNAPNLRRVSMSVADDAIWGFNDRSFLPWSKLTHITSINPFSLAQTIFLFERTPNLVHYKGKISQFSINESDIHEGRIPLLFLQSLFIIESLPRNLQVVTNLYDCIEAPKLESVTYVSHHSGESPIPIPILPLLRRSHHLQYFCLDGNDLNLWDLGTILQAIPSITDLVIGQEESYYAPFRIPTLPLTLNGPNTRHSQVWTLDELVVRNNGDSEVNPPLPRLTSLLLSSHSPWISDDTLFDLIRSRMTASPQLAALERVKGIFRRAAERDLAKELAHHAELMGVEMIDLDLMYGQRQQARSDEVTSPAFGLRRFNAPSWIHEDAGEMTYRWRGSGRGRAPTILSG